MRVLVDARAAAARERTGVGTYVWNLLRRLPAADPSATFVAWYLDARSRGRAARFDGLRAPNLVERRTRIPARLFDALAARLSLPPAEWLARFDVLFAPNFVPPPARTSRLVLTVHDLAFRRLPATAPARTLRWLEGFPRALARAARVIAVSECTRRDLVELFPVDPGRVHVVAHGVDREVYRPASPEEVARARRRYGVPEPYLLSVGALEPRKNLPELVGAFARLPRSLGLHLVVAGSGVPWNPEGRAGLEAALRALPPEVARRVVLTGYLPEPDEVALLTGAVALVYPSLYEGFGLPALEAMACGTPVLASATSALPEVVGEAGLLVDPTDREALAAAMERMARDEALRSRLREAGLRRAAAFSWEATAAGTARVLRLAAEEG